MDNQLENLAAGLGFLLTNWICFNYQFPSPVILKIENGWF